MAYIDSYFCFIFGFFSSLFNGAINKLMKIKIKKVFCDTINNLSISISNYHILQFIFIFSLDISSLISSKQVFIKQYLLIDFSQIFRVFVCFLIYNSFSFISSHPRLNLFVFFSQYFNGVFDVDQKERDRTLSK